MVNLYYFTSAEYAKSNIENNRIRISRFLELNDPFELLGVNLGNKETRKKFRDLKKQLNEKEGLICLSRNWRNPLMWGHYANQHKGIVLGFEVKKTLCKKVEYKSKLIDPPKNPSTNSLNDFMDQLKVIKFEDWKYENEVRVIQKLFENVCIKDGKHYFRKFNDDFILKEVIFGQNCTKKNKDKIHDILNERNSTVKIIPSRIAFTRFEVLTNQAATNADKKLEDDLKNISDCLPLNYILVKSLLVKPRG
ncbi:DUF2971 domain-containing protein [Arsenophonus sp. aPb]|uniref:DUF2971 domain-containing protein n=1 Tax=Arsenophonus sp. aPb TaxID=3041619 RepID=UPI0024688F30|nr:DUF2971 domain-containing protein [Arsenophonus sp. aPb]WGL97897.1 DUF2971 domain-containing protein [Arsenophonus sp. aPb]